MTFSWGLGLLLETQPWHCAEEVVVKGRADSGWDVGSPGTNTGADLFLA